MIVVRAAMIFFAGVLHSYRRRRTRVARLLARPSERNTDNESRACLIWLRLPLRAGWLHDTQPTKVYRAVGAIDGCLLRFEQFSRDAPRKSSLGSAGDTPPTFRSSVATRRGHSLKILEVGWAPDIGAGHMGPVTNVIFQLSRAFAELGHDVTLVTGSTTGERTLLPKDVHVIECAAATSMWGNPRARRMSRLSSNLKGNSQYPYIKELTSILDVASFDVIHAHLDSHAALLHRVMHTNCAYTIHTPLWADPALYRGVKGLVRNAMKQAKIAVGIHAINVIQEAWLAIVLGQFVKQQIRGGNVVVIPNGVNVRDWPVVDKARARAESRFREDEFVILFAASIRPIKGLPVLLRAVESLSKKNVGIRLVVLGHFSNELKQQTKGLPVELCGFVSNRTEMFRAYLAGADVVVVPSLFDNQPTVVLEAMAMGTPVVASRVGAIPDMVSEDVGMLFEPGDHAELARLLELLWREPSRRKSFAAKCRPWVEAKFTWEACANAYLAAFERRLLGAMG